MRLKLGKQSGPPAIQKIAETEVLREQYESVDHFESVQLAGGVNTVVKGGVSRTVVVALLAFVEVTEDIVRFPLNNTKRGRWHDVWMENAHMREGKGKSTHREALCAVSQAAVEDLGPKTWARIEQS